MAQVVDTDPFMLINTMAAYDLETQRTKASGPLINIKTVFSRYEDSHVKDMMVVRWVSLYW